MTWLLPRAAFPLREREFVKVRGERKYRRKIFLIG